MDKRFFQLLFSGFIIASITLSCEKNKDNDDGDDLIIPPESSYIADYTVAKEAYLRSIPQQYINEARNNLHVAYQHTSHGTHVSYGLFGLQDFQSGDGDLFGITNNNPTTNKLDFRDCVISNSGLNPVSAADLGNPDETAFIHATRSYLDDPQNAAINVVMWSWCDISGHNISENYLPGMQTLIDEYGVGGSKIGTGEGQRENAVTFIFMTGHGNPGSNVGDGNPKNQADLITNFCKLNNQYCLDYYSIDTHDLEDNYWEDTGDNGNSAAYGGNFYHDWQAAHSLGEDYYENKSAPNGEVACGDHTDQHITSNRKAFAMWYILACIAGYNPDTAD